MKILLNHPAVAPAIHLTDLLTRGREVRRCPLALVTGHPRSGTHFTARMVRELGHVTSIEGRWMSGRTRLVSSWKHAQPGMFRNRFYARSMRQDFDTVLHQVRHPLHVIASSTTLVDRTVDHIKKYVDIPEPTVSHDQSITLCMRSWLGWNRLIEPTASWRFQLEELDDVCPEFCRRIGIPEQASPGMGARNTRVHRALTWGDLEAADAKLAVQVREMAQRYGYADA